MIPTIKQQYQELYGFTPTKEQANTLYKMENSELFSQLEGWKTRDYFKKRLGWRDKQLKRVIRQLKAVGLIHQQGEWLCRYNFYANFKRNDRESRSEQLELFQKLL